MARTRLLVHIRPDAPPERILKLLHCLARDPQNWFSTVLELNEHAIALGVARASEMESVAAMAQLLGLLTRGPDGVGLSAEGRIIVQARETAQADLLHYLFYTRWSAQQPTEAVKSWAYRNSLDAYWDAHTVQLTPEFLDRRAQSTVNDAEQTFGALGVYDLAEVSFGRKSLAAIYLWLAALQPAVLVDGHFTRRAFCSAELLLLAIGWTLAGEDEAVAGDVLLSQAKREAICRLCLLEPGALDATLDWMLPAYPDVIAPGTTAGFYGRFVRFLRRPMLADVVR